MRRQGFSGGAGRMAACVIGVLLAAGSVQAAMIYPVDQADTGYWGNGSRHLNSMTFGGASTVMTGADLLRFDDGFLFSDSTAQTPAISGGWTDPLPRDISGTGNVYLFNPDRADFSPAFADEVTSEGTLAEVFGANAEGFKDLSWILDGEEAEQTYYVDLYFNGFQLSGDGNDDTVEIAVLERGGNSDFNVYGIFEDERQTVTAPLFISRADMGPALWTLNTLEIGNDQGVTGVGISIDRDWSNLIGVRIESAGANFSGPDIVAVGVVPEPMSAVLVGLGLAAIAFGRRR